MYNENRSTHEIAEHFGTYTNKIRRILIKNGKVIRDRATAQAIAIKSGRATHPTKGKKRGEDVKQKISQGIHDHWKNMSDEDREERSELGRAQWEAMSDADKTKLQTLAAKGVRKAAKEGSKVEKFVRNYLTQKGFVVIFHQKNLIPNNDMEIDLFVPELKTAIEIDGPAHFLPIWGEDNLKKHIRADAEKSGLLISKGYCVLRVKNTRKNVSNIQMRQVAEQIEKKLLEIRKKFPAKTQRFIELEVA